MPGREAAGELGGARAVPGYPAPSCWGGQPGRGRSSASPASPPKKEQRERVCEALGLDHVAHGGPHVPAGHSGGDCPFCRTMLRQGWPGSRPGAHPAAAADKPSVLAHLAVTRGRNVNSNGRR